VAGLNQKIHDQVVMIGARKTLVGIMTQPANYEPGDRPVFVILNSGIIHRVGHHRMYVSLARALAGAGHQVLRFDLSGIGDSEAREDGLSLLEAALADVREVVDWLVTARRAGRIILVGLCSGADQSLVYGISDPRVCGLVLLDPSIPPTYRYYLNYFLHHSMAAKSWINFVSGRGAFWKRLRKFLRLVHDDAWEHYRLNLGDPPIRQYLQNAYQRSMDLRMQCLAVFTSGLPHQHNYRRQILDAFPTVRFMDRLQLEYFAGSDHVFTSETDRSRLFAIVMAWARTADFARQAGVEPTSRQVVDVISTDYVSYEV
jgi:pimeloyl-ACP methyl ester carboxylesterase